MKKITTFALFAGLSLISKLNAYESSFNYLDSDGIRAELKAEKKSGLISLEKTSVIETAKKTWAEKQKAEYENARAALSSSHRHCLKREHAIDIFDERVCFSGLDTKARMEDIGKIDWSQKLDPFAYKADPKLIIQCGLYVVYGKRHSIRKNVSRVYTPMVIPAQFIKEYFEHRAEIVCP